MEANLHAYIRIYFDKSKYAKGLRFELKSDFDRGDFILAVYKDGRRFRVRIAEENVDDAHLNDSRYDGDRIVLESRRKIDSLLDDAIKLALSNHKLADEEILTSLNHVQWDVFICHASEDKERFVRPLAEALSQAGLDVWYDEFTLKLGDSLRQKIDEGLAKSSYGVVVLSHDFFTKPWPQTELDGLAVREVGGKKVILPLWHNITQAEVAKHSPTLAGRVAVSTSKGMAVVVEKILEVIRPA